MAHLEMEGMDKSLEMEVWETIWPMMETGDWIDREMEIPERDLLVEME